MNIKARIKILNIHFYNIKNNIKIYYSNIYDEERRQFRDGKHFYLKLFYLHIMILLLKYFFKTLTYKLFKSLPETLKQNILSTFSQNLVHNTTHFYSYEIYIICLYTTIRCILAY